MIVISAKCDMGERPHAYHDHFQHGPDPPRNCTFGYSLLISPDHAESILAFNGGSQRHESVLANPP